MIHSSADPTDLVMSAESCRQLLSSARVARVAFVDNGLPQLVVMNYLLDGDSVLLQTSDDTRLAARTSGPGTVIRVQLEVDSASASSEFGWSVIASGSLARDGGVGSQDLPAPWRRGATGVALRLTIDELTGRRVG